MRHSASSPAIRRLPVALLGGTRLGLAFLLLCGAALAVAVRPAQAATTIVVNTTSDTPGAGLCTLRNAIATVNANGTPAGSCAGGTGPFTIDLTSRSGVISLSTTGLTISNSVTILGPGPASLTVTRNPSSGTFRIFTVNSGTVTIQSLKITNGNASSEPPGSRVGNGIYNNGTLTLSNVRLENNSETTLVDGGGVYNSGTLTISNQSLLKSNAARQGGGAYNVGTLTVDNVTFDSNSASDPATGTGGGIRNPGASGPLTVTNSYFYNNTAARNGGAVYNSSPDPTGNINLVTRSLFESNHANGTASGEGGGGIFNTGLSGALVISNSTFTGNTSAKDGGAIQKNDGSLSIWNSTIVNNSASATTGNGGGLAAPAIAAIHNTIVANNTASSAAVSNCSGSVGVFTSIEFPASTGCGALTPGDPFPGSPPALADNGGPTRTIAIPASSPAKDAGDISATDGCANSNVGTVDQRGVNRSLGPQCDIGAFEYVPSQPTLVMAFDPSTIEYGRVSRLTFAISNPNPTALSKVSFKVALPAHLVVANPPSVSSSCVAPGTVTPPATGSSGTIDVAGVGLNATPYSCTISLKVTSGNTDSIGTWAATNSVAIKAIEKLDGTSVVGPISLTVNRDNTSTAVASSANPSVFGQSITLTATVTRATPCSPTPCSGLPASGTVTFKEGATILGMGILNGSGQATLMISTLPVAADALTAVYSGDDNYNASAGSLTQTVNKATTLVGVQSLLNPSQIGDGVTFKATVLVLAPGSGSPTGNVTFLDGDAELGTVALDASTGQATFSSSTLFLGDHQIKAVYSGDSSFKTSTSSPSPQTVKGFATVTTLSASRLGAKPGEPVSFTMTVAPKGGSATTVIGSVALKDGASDLTTVPLDNGTATFTSTALPLGTHTLTAVYTGGGTFDTSTSTPVTVVIQSGGHAYLPMAARP